MSDIQFQKNFSAFIGNVGPVSPQTEAGKTQNTDRDGEFYKLFEKMLGDKPKLTISKHAQSRMETRNIEMTPQLAAKLNDAVDRAKGKGVKDALIFTDQTAFIVNIPNSTIVTALKGQEMKENIFTNIDGAVII
ncbi:MAG: TIGR02530 family flagellar biosynthesis protein [Bacillota bacterium]|nr:TIGR02530 family flagellar biosynthesis protein [Bacillota bacterium]